jgi:hypothetical protein
MASSRQSDPARRPPAAAISPLGDPHAVLGGGLAGLELLVRLDVLRRDLAAILAGAGPTENDLARAPLLDGWSLSARSSPCLTGVVLGHPRLPQGPIVTSELWALSHDRHWARTRSRWYCLGEPRDDAA